MALLKYVRNGPYLDVELVEAAGFEIRRGFVRGDVAPLQLTLVEEPGAPVREDIAQANTPVDVGGVSGCEESETRRPDDGKVRFERQGAEPERLEFEATLVAGIGRSPVGSSWIVDKYGRLGLYRR